LGDLFAFGAIALTGTVYFFGVIAIIVAIIYLIFKRIKDKKKETFEKRDN